MIPTFLAIAAAVRGWSPVTMMTFIPASWHFLTEKSTYFHGGSFNEIKPMKHKPSIGKL